MPLTLLVPLLIASIALIWALTELFGGSALALLDEETARRRFLQDYPEAHIQSLSVARDRLSALLWLGSEGGLVFTIGDKFATRKLKQARIVAVEDGLRVELDDFGAPRVHVALDERELPIWRERLHA